MNCSARIFVSNYIDTVFSNDGSVSVSVEYLGFVRISNVEFNLFGQYSTYDDGDFAYGISLLNLGDYNVNRPTYVKGSAFHNGFSAAIGKVNSNGIPITNNVSTIH